MKDLNNLKFDLFEAAEKISDEGSKVLNTVEKKVNEGIELMKNGFCSFDCFLEGKISVEKTKEGSISLKCSDPQNLECQNCLDSVYKKFASN